MAGVQHISNHLAESIKTGLAALQQITQHANTYSAQITNKRQSGL